MNKKIILLSMMVSAYLFGASSYVCENDPEYKSYSNGEQDSIPKSVLYQNNNSCEQDCRVYDSCNSYKTEITNEQVFSTTSYLNEIQKNNIETKFNKKVFSVTVEKDGINYSALFPNGYNLSSWTAPTGMPTAKNPILKNKYTYGDFSLTWNKFLTLEEHYITGFGGKNIKDLLDNAFDKNWKDGLSDAFANNRVQIIKIEDTEIPIKSEDLTKEPTIPGIIYDDGDNYIKSIRSGADLYLEYKLNGKVTKLFNIPDSNTSTYSITFFEKGYSTKPKYSIDTKIKDTVLKMEIGEYANPLGGNNQHKYSIDLGLQDSGYKCPDFGVNVDLGGDVKGNLFSKKNSCETKCYSQNSCAPYEAGGDCKMVSSKETNPVTDYTGKIVYTKKIFDWSCSKKETKIVGCKAWEYSTTEGNLTYSSKNPGQDDLDFSNNFGEALGAATISENASHIWSGWRGYCEKGIKVDDSWLSDPMQLLSLAMMAYTGALSGGYGAAAQSAAKAGTQSVLDASSSAVSWGNDVGVISDDAMFSATDSIWSASETVSEAGTAVSNIHSISDVVDSSVKYISNASNLELLGYAAHVASIVAPLLANVDEQDVKNADNYMMASLGESSTDQKAVAYANCMSSIGLSFVNVSASAVDSNETSEELKTPFKHPSRLTYEQFSKLQVLTAQKKINIKKNFLITKVGGDALTIVPYSKIALQTIGQAVCSPLKEAIIMNNRSTESVKKSNSGNAQVEAAGMAAASMAIGMLPPPYNLIGSVILKVFTSVENGDACKDEKIAQKWGLIEAKTNKSLKGGQCHLQKGKCQEKWAWGSCKLKRTYYCCFDQESTRIFVEAAKEELGKTWDSCNNISIYDLKNISFRKCKASENSFRDKCISSSKYNELSNSLTKKATKNLSAKRIVGEALDGLQLPGQTSPWEK